MNSSELNALTINELYALAKQHGIPSFRKYKKAELIELLQAPAPAPKKRGRPAKAAKAPEAEASEKPVEQPAEQPAPETPEKPAEQPAEKPQERTDGEQRQRYPRNNYRQQNGRQNQGRTYRPNNRPYRAPEGEQKPEKPAEPAPLPETGKRQEQDKGQDGTQGLFHGKHLRFSVFLPPAYNLTPRQCQ